MIVIIAIIILIGDWAGAKSQAKSVSEQAVTCFFFSDLLLKKQQKTVRKRGINYMQFPPFSILKIHLLVLFFVAFRSTRS